MIKKFFPLLAILALLTACGQESGDHRVSDGGRQFDTTDASFEDYKQDFLAEGAVLAVSVNADEIPINFGDLDSLESSSVKDEAHDSSHSHNENCTHEKDEKNNSYHYVSIKDTSFALTVGVCIEYSNGEKEILIRESSWNTFSDAKREVLIFHELGHCALGLNHNDQTYRGYALSVMNSLLINQSHYLQFIDGYMEELFLQDSVNLEADIDNYLD